MKIWIGLIMVVAGIGLGLYAGIWWAFIGGIVQIIEQIKGPELSALTIAIGVAKIMFAGVIGFVSGIILFIPGMHLINEA